LTAWVNTCWCVCESPKMMNSQLTGMLKNGQQIQHRYRCSQKLTGMSKRHQGGGHSPAGM